MTVGTTLAFDPLIEAVNKMVETGEINEGVVGQIGHGTYVARAYERFRFTPDIDQSVRKATVVIGHGETNTVYSLFALGKPSEAVAYPVGADNH